MSLLTKTLDEAEQIQRELDEQGYDRNEIADILDAYFGGRGTDPTGQARLDEEYRDLVDPETQYRQEDGFSRLRDTTGIFAEIFEGMGRTDLLETGGQLLEIIAQIASEGRPVAPADLPGLVDLSQEDQEAFLEAINQYNELSNEQDLEGPPEELPTELEEDPFEDTVFDIPVIGVEPDMPIDIPPPTLPPREEGEEDGEGAGEGAGEGNGNGEEDKDEEQETARGEGDNSGYQFPDYGDIGQDYEPPLPRGQGGTIYDVPVQDDPGFTVGIGVPVLGSIGSGGGDGGNGGGGGGGQPRGMLDPRFKPYMASIGYTPVAVPKAILPQAPIVSSLFGEYFT